MKIVFIGLLSLAFVVGRPGYSLAQEKNSPIVIYYIDSARIDFGLDYLDPQNITKIDVVRDKALPGENSGRVYITWKTPHPIFFSLADIAGMQSIKGSPIKKGFNILYIIDDSVISDPGSIRIDPSIIVQVRAIDISDLPYLGKDTPFMAILQIRTKRLFPPKPGQIIIRG